MVRLDEIGVAEKNGGKQLDTRYFYFHPRAHGGADDHFFDVFWVNGGN